MASQKAYLMQLASGTDQNQKKWAISILKSEYGMNDFDIELHSTTRAIKSNLVRSTMLSDAIARMIKLLSRIISKK